MLARINKALAKKDSGFTLIELLVVVIIIGILAAIAIPTFLNQRERAWERAVQSDLRNAAVVMEEEFNDTGTYAGLVGAAIQAASNTSDDVTLDAATADVTSYCIDGTHLNLPTSPFHLDSTDGVVTAGTC
jgi:type IV pilus assembly protein PilA